MLIQELKCDYGGCYYSKIKLGLHENWWIITTLADKGKSFSICARRLSMGDPVPATALISCANHPQQLMAQEMDKFGFYPTDDEPAVAATEKSNAD